MIRCAFLLIYCVTLLHCNNKEVEKKVDKFLKKYNDEAAKLQHDDTLASWDYETDMNDKTKKKTVEMTAKTSKFALKSRSEAKDLLKMINVNEISPEMNSSIRELKLITFTASSNSTSVSEEEADLISDMTAIYSKTSLVNIYKLILFSNKSTHFHQISNYANRKKSFFYCSLLKVTMNHENVGEIVKTIDKKDYKFKLNAHLLPIMSEVSKENLGNLRWAWNVWRESVGKKMKSKYERFVKLINKGARENGFSDYGEYWRKEYEVENLEEMMENIVKEMMPLYKKLHAFTRYKLRRNISASLIEEKGLIPAHLLGMWAQNWGHLYSMMNPFPKKVIPDVTKTMMEKEWTVTKILQTAEAFFTSIGLEKMPQSFWTKSMLSKEEGKKAVCHPSSWDLGGGDARLKMPCMGVSQGDFITAHHEMGHIEYYLLYKDQPTEFRTGANPGFHEAVGDTVALSVMIPEHLSKIGLLDEAIGDEEEQMNFLLKQALQKVAFIPFAYIVDKYRWAVFSGCVTPDKYNDFWWKLKKIYQGVEEPTKRDDADLFDAGTFFHVAHNTEYLRYFLSHILQFQFHESLCDISGHKGPYHNCSIHNSLAAGERLREMLSLGKEKPWPEALEVLCRTKQLSSKPLLDYFKPLENWLDSHRRQNDYPLGWDTSSIHDPCLKSSTPKT